MTKENAVERVNLKDSRNKLADSTNDRISL
jgi:hypothetical protein